VPTQVLENDRDSARLPYLFLFKLEFLLPQPTIEQAGGATPVFGGTRLKRWFASSTQFCPFAHLILRPLFKEPSPRRRPLRGDNRLAKDLLPRTCLHITIYRRPCLYLFRLGSDSTCSVLLVTALRVTRRSHQANALLFCPPFLASKDIAVFASVTPFLTVSLIPIKVIICCQ
jgi:hypothetical protein